MEIDLNDLREMHPLLPQITAMEYVHLAVLGLGGQAHSPGVEMSVVLDDRTEEGRLLWPESDPQEAMKLDAKHITEGAAEAVALGLVYTANRWQVRRRLQQGECGDWLLRDGNQRTVALEVSGVAGEDTSGVRLRQKIKQVARCPVPGVRAACVVELKLPRSNLKRV